MNSFKIWANLAVKDVARTAEFYRAMGFTPNGNPTAELASFLFGKDGFIIHFFKQEKLEAAMNRKAADLSNGTEVMFSISAQSEQEVREWVDRATAAGGGIFRQPSKDENGYFYCGFADPDGHQFNVLLVTKGM